MSYPQLIPIFPLPSSMYFAILKKRSAIPFLIMDYKFELVSVENPKPYDFEGKSGISYKVNILIGNSLVKLSLDKTLHELLQSSGERGQVYNGVFSVSAKGTLKLTGFSR